MEQHGSVSLASAHSALTEPDGLFRSLREINRCCIELMVKSAQRLVVSNEGTRLVGALHRKLVTLSPAMQESVACSPFLLVGLCFRDVEWWQQTSKHPANDHHEPHWRPYFPKSAAIRMTRSTLFLSWHAANTAPEFASVTLGIHSQVIAYIREINLNVIDEIANHHFARLLPRWEDRPIAWKHLLDAVLEPQNSQIQPFNIHGLLLTAGEQLSKQ